MRVGFSRLCLNPQCSLGLGSLFVSGRSGLTYTCAGRRASFLLLILALSLLWGHRAA